MVNNIGRWQPCFDKLILWTSYLYNNYYNLRLIEVTKWLFLWLRISPRFIFSQLNNVMFTRKVHFREFNLCFVSKVWQLVRGQYTCRCCGAQYETIPVILAIPWLKLMGIEKQSRGSGIGQAVGTEKTIWHQEINLNSNSLLDSIGYVFWSWLLGYGNISFIQRHIDGSSYCLSFVN